MHSVAVLLAIADAQGDVRQEEGLGEEVSEDAVVVRQPLDLKRARAPLPALLHAVQGDLDCRVDRQGSGVKKCSRALRLRIPLLDVFKPLFIYF